MWLWIQLKSHPPIPKCIISHQFSLCVSLHLNCLDFISICVDSIEYTWGRSEKSHISQNLKADANYWRWINYCKVLLCSVGATRLNKRVPRSNTASECLWQQLFSRSNCSKGLHWTILSLEMNLGGLGNGYKALIYMQLKPTNKKVFIMLII